jgi:hypothetical protein
MDGKILDFSHATAEEVAAAKRVSEKLGLGEIYFAYNVPIQVFLAYKEEDNPKSGIDPYRTCVWNYMPRKNRIDEETLADIFSDPDSLTKDDFNDFMIATSAIFRNLSKEMLKLGEGKTDTVYYPNCES